MAKQEIGGVEFKNQAEIKKYISALKDRYKNEEPVSYADDRFLRALLSRHDFYSEKRGVGIESVYVDTDAYGSRCFWLTRPDGSKTAWSYKSCLSEKRVSELTWFSMAGRDAIKAEILSFWERNCAPGIACPYTGELLGHNNTHVDHAPPWTFVAIRDAFIEEKAIDLSRVEYM